MLMRPRPRPFTASLEIKTSPEITHSQKDLIPSTSERYLDVP